VKKEDWEKALYEESKLVKQIDNLDNTARKRSKRYCIYTKFINDYIDINEDYVILDIGCREYGLIDFLDKGIKFSLDPIIDLYSGFHNNSGVKCIKGVGEQLPFRKNSFDIVIMTNVLDHVYKPLMVLKESYRVIRKDGFLVISLDVFSFTNIIKLVRETLGLKRDVYHMHSFTHKRIERMLINTGFVLLGKKSMPGEMQVRNKYKELLYNNMLVYIDHFFDKRITAPSEDILFICRKD